MFESLMGYQFLDAEPGGLPAPVGSRLVLARACASVAPASSGWLTGTAPGLVLKTSGALIGSAGQD